MVLSKKCFTKLCCRPIVATMLIVHIKYKQRGCRKPADGGGLLISSRRNFRLLISLRNREKQRSPPYKPDSEKSTLDNASLKNESMRTVIEEYINCESNTHSLKTGQT